MDTTRIAAQTVPAASREVRMVVRAITRSV